MEELILVSLDEAIKQIKKLTMELNEIKIKIAALEEQQLDKSIYSVKQEDV